MRILVSGRGMYGNETAMKRIPEDTLLVIGNTFYFKRNDEKLWIKLSYKRFDKDDLKWLVILQQHGLTDVPLKEEMIAINGQPCYPTDYEEAIELMSKYELTHKDLAENITLNVIPISNREFNANVLKQGTWEYQNIKRLTPSLIKNPFKENYKPIKTWNLDNKHDEIEEEILH